jgi:hypothetical protein
MGRKLSVVPSRWGSALLGFIVIVNVLLQVESENLVQTVSNAQEHRLTTEGWQETKKEFLYGFQKQMESRKLSSSKGRAVPYKKHGPKNLQQEMDYDRGNDKYDPQNHHPQSLETLEIKKYTNGVYYDSNSGSYIDPKLLIPMVNTTTTSSSKSMTSIDSNDKTTVTTITKIVVPNGDVDNDGLYYDPVSGSVLSSSTGDIIPNSFIYYARKGNGGSKKSKKAHKKSCKKKKKGKGKGKSGKKSKKKYDECADRKPNVHPDKANPKECIYDYANHIRYCKSKCYFF